MCVHTYKITAAGRLIGSLSIYRVWGASSHRCRLAKAAIWVARCPNRVPKEAQDGPKGSPRIPKGLREEAQSRPKCPQSHHLRLKESQQGPKGNPKWSKGEPKDPKGTPQGVKGAPRADKIPHRRSKIAEIYENNMFFFSHYFLKSQRARILKCASRVDEMTTFFGKLVFYIHETPTF